MYKTMRQIILTCFFIFITTGVCFAGSQQTSGDTAQDIIDNAKYEYLDDAGGAYWDDDSKLLDILNRGVLQIAAITECMETVEKVPLLTGITEYAISSNYILVKKAIYSGATTVYDSRKGLKRIDIQNIALENENVGEPVRYYVWNDYVGIEPDPSSAVSGYAVYLYMIERPSAIALTGTIPTPAIYDHALTLFVAYQAFRKDKQINRSNQLREEYLAELQFYGTKIESLRTPKGKIP